MLVLLRHDWTTGQVHTLIHTVRQAVAIAKSEQCKDVNCTHIRNLQLQNDVISLLELGEEEARRQFYSLLIDDLKSQGYSKGEKGMPLLKRVAEILNVAPSVISQRLNKLGMRI